MFLEGVHENTVQPSLSDIHSGRRSFVRMRRKQPPAPVFKRQSGKHCGAGRQGAIHRDWPIQFHADVGFSGIGKLVAEPANYRPAQRHVWSWTHQPAIHGAVPGLYRTHYHHRDRTDRCQQFKPFHLIYDICTFGASTYGHSRKWIRSSNSDNELPLAARPQIQPLGAFILCGRMNE